MRIVADLATNRIIEVTSTPATGVGTAINGKYIFPVPAGAALTISSDPAYATGSVTVNAAPATAGAVLLLGGVTLNAFAGARTSGSNNFDCSLGAVADIATDMVAAINDPNNGFDAFLSASADAAIVTLTAVPAGSAGNLISLASVHADYTVSGAFLIGGEGDHLIPQDGSATDIGARAAQEFLIRYPMYDYVTYNYLLEASDIAALDLAPAAPTQPGTRPRCQVGRGIGPSSVGQAPCSTVLLAQNAYPGTHRPGIVITDTIDLSGVVPGGTDEVMLWWKLMRRDYTTIEDVVYGYGVTANNSPSIRTLTEVVDQPAGIVVYASNDDGVNWYQADYLEPTDLVNLGTNLRICFVNNTAAAYYLLGFVVLFEDTP